jgi:hypothetical protein
LLLVRGLSSLRADLPPEVTDAVTHRAYDAVKCWTDWLRANAVNGYLGETGWPNESMGERPDVDQWDALGNKLLSWLDSAEISVTGWGASRMSGWYDPFVVYGPNRWDVPPGERQISTARRQAAVFERHPTSASYLRGMNVNGGELMLTIPNTFSNENPGTIGTDYWYPDYEDFAYLRSRGHLLARVPFRWERVQPKLGKPLSSVEVSRLESSVAAAGRAGMKAVLDVHNFANYRTTASQENRIGSTRVPISAFLDLWHRLALRFKENPALHGFDLMNEPYGMPGGPAQWENTSQQALHTIRNAGVTRKVVYVSGYHEGSAGRDGIFAFVLNHPGGWITDCASNFAYTTHAYWGRHNYRYTYEEDNAYWSLRGYRGKRA